MNIVFVTPRSLLPCLALLIAVTFPNCLFGYTKSGNIYATNGSQSDVNAAISNASAGDTVNIPAGTFTWGAGGLGTVVNKAITLSGNSKSSTIINQTSDSSGLIYASSAGAVIKSFTANQTAACRLFVCTTGGVSGWRFTDIAVNGVSGRLWDLDNSPGLVDHCDIGMPSEQIFMYGDPAAWQNPPSMGTAQAVYFEDCNFYGDGYSDGNSNAKMVFRFNTINGCMKFDQHGIFSDSPAHAGRHIEVYNNHWTSTSQGGFWPSVHIRGGTGRVFNNTIDDSTFIGRGIIELDEYAALQTGGYFGSVYKTPADYPLKDQVGVGRDPLSGGSEPLYLWGNIKGGGPLNPMGSDIVPGAIAQYQSQTGNSSATFTMVGASPTAAAMINADRDYFNSVPSFNGSSGVGTGTKMQMLAITPTRTGVGFWVTNEGSWNTNLPVNTSGQLYTWNGGQWILNYTPYAYPHPLILARPNPPTGLRVK